MSIAIGFLVVVLASATTSVIRNLVCQRNRRQYESIHQRWTEGILIGRVARRNSASGTVQVLWDNVGWMDEPDPFHCFISTEEPMTFQGCKIEDIYGHYATATQGCGYTS